MDLEHMPIIGVLPSGTVLSGELMDLEHMPIIGVLPSGTVLSGELMDLEYTPLVGCYHLVLFIWRAHRPRTYATRGGATIWYF